MKRFVPSFVPSTVVLSTVSVLLAAGALSPMAQAAEMNNEKANNLHQVRLENLDQRSKNLEVKPGFNVHRVYIQNLDRRNKVGDKVSTTPLIGQRHLRLDK
jgi:hypothetical protein